MSWVNPVFPIDTENSIGFIVQFFGGQARLVGDSEEYLVRNGLNKYREKNAMF